MQVSASDVDGHFGEVVKYEIQKVSIKKANY